MTQYSVLKEKNTDVHLWKLTKKLFIEKKDRKKELPRGKDKKTRLGLPAESDRHNVHLGFRKVTIQV